MRLVVEPDGEHLPRRRHGWAQQQRVDRNGGLRVERGGEVEERAPVVEEWLHVGTELPARGRGHVDPAHPRGVGVGDDRCPSAEVRQFHRTLRFDGKSHSVERVAGRPGYSGFWPITNPIGSGVVRSSSWIAVQPAPRRRSVARSASSTAPPLLTVRSVDVA